MPNILSIRPMPTRTRTTSTALATIPPTTAPAPAKKPRRPRRQPKELDGRDRADLVAAIGLVGLLQSNLSLLWNNHSTRDNFVRRIRTELASLERLGEFLNHTLQAGEIR